RRALEELSRLLLITQKAAEALSWGALAEVEESLESLKRRWPQVPLWAPLEAEWLQLQGRYEAALESLESALDKLPHPHLEQRRLSLLSLLGRSEARPLARRLWLENRGSRRQLSQLSLSLERGAAHEADGWPAQRIEALAVNDPLSRAAWVELAQLQVRRGHLNTALSTLARMPGRPSPEARALRATIMEQLGDRETAISELRARLQDQPNDEETTLRLARLNAQAPLPPLGPSIDRLRDRARSEAPIDPSAPAEHLYTHVHLDEDEIGRSRRRHREVFLIRDPHGAAALRFSELSYLPSAQGLTIEGVDRWRGGRRRVGLAARSQRSLSRPDERLYYEAVVERLDLGPLQAGDLIDLRWRLEDLDPGGDQTEGAGRLFFLQGPLPRREGHLSLSPALAERLQVMVSDHRVTADARGERFSVDSLIGVPPLKDDLGPSGRWAHVVVARSKTWAYLDAAYQAQLNPHLSRSEQLRALAIEWAGLDEKPAGLLSPKQARVIVDQLYLRLTQEIRYVGVEFGAHSFFPATPDEVLTRRFGDCKDRALLLISLARALGVELRFVMVRSRPRGALIEGSPPFLGAFDHALVYQPALNRFLDPTLTLNDPNSLPLSDQGAQVLVSGEGKLRQLPPLPPERHQRTLSLIESHSEESVKRGLNFDLELSLNGPLAMEARHHILAVGAEEWARRALSEWLAGTWNIKTLKVDGLTPSRDPLRLSGAITTLGTLKEFITPALHPQLVTRYAPNSSRGASLFRVAQDERFMIQLSALRWRHLADPFERKHPSESDIARWSFTERPDARRLSIQTRWPAKVLEERDYLSWRSWLQEVERKLGAAARRFDHATPRGEGSPRP
ncbi:MAG: DUF3857 domain-containing protein, partial [Myxococcota bacterium]|nr:DUF3857 domain-containing protein [Myxococcota bacterium]